MKVLITGGIGCIGLALAKKLKNNKIDFVCYDQPGKVFQLQSMGIAIPPTIVGSILDRALLETSMKDITHVVHLAAHLGVHRTEKERKKCLEVNILGSKNVIEVADAYGVKNFINASSSEVYGRPERKKITEKDNTQGFSVYAISKLASEELLKAQVLISPNKMVGYNLRLFNTFGPIQVAQFVIPRFLSAIQNKKNIMINGDGKQIRSYCYVDDTVEGIYRCIKKKPKISEQVITLNLGNPNNEINLINLAKLISKIYKEDIKNYKILGNFKGTDRLEKREIDYRVCSISKAKKLIGFSPKISLEKGLTKLIKSYQNISSWPSEYIIDKDYM